MNNPIICNTPESLPKKLNGINVIGFSWYTNNGCALPPQSSISYESGNWIFFAWGGDSECTTTFPIPLCKCTNQRIFNALMVAVKDSI